MMLTHCGEIPQAHCYGLNDAPSGNTVWEVMGPLGGTALPQGCRSL